MSILLFDPNSRTMLTSMIKPFTYPLCYIMGTSLFIKDKEGALGLEETAKSTATIIYVLAGGAMAHFLLNMMLNRNAVDRHVIDFWTRKEMSATGQAALACLMIAVAVTFLFSKVGKRKKIIAILALAFIVSYNLILAGRTIFSFILILVGVALFYTFFVNKKQSVKIIVVVLLIAAALILCYQYNVFGIRNAVESSNFYNRFFGNSDGQQIDEDNRMANKKVYLSYFVDYLWGGGHIRKVYGHYAHDLYLDTYDNAGIFALLAVLVYIILSLVRMVRCLKSKLLRFEARLLIILVYLVCNIQFWLEPILDGAPWLFASYCLIDGAITYLLSKEKRLQANA